MSVRAAVCVALMVALVPPFGYYLLSSRHQAGQLEAEASIRGYLISQIVSQNPDLWKYQVHGIEDVLGRSFGFQESEARSVVDADGVALFEYRSIQGIRWPRMTRAASIYDFARKVGEIEVGRSLDGVLTRTGLIALAAFAVATLVFLALRVFPSRAIELVWNKAIHDPLTRLPNRITMGDCLAGARLEARQSGARLVVMCIDLDRFKEANDTYGHTAGDLVLRVVADRLREETRTGDSILRVGGDEFVLISSTMHTADQATAVAERIIAALSRPIAWRDHEINISASVGIVVSGAVTANPAHVVELADTAMYEAKALGPGHYRIRDLTHNVADLAA